MTSESQTVEWKRSLGEWKEIVETCAAFATAGGGTVYVGLSPDGSRPGVVVGKGTLEDLANKIKTNTDPPQYPSIKVDGDPSSAVLEIRVEPNPIKPVWAFGRPVKRVGRTNQVLRRDESQRMLEVSTGRTWDALICPVFSRRDLDMGAVRDFLGRAGMGKSTPLTAVMRNLRLGDETRFRNAAVLLFGKSPQRFFVEARVKCARFAGGSLTRFLDERTIEGNVLCQLDETIAFVTRNTRQALVVTGKPAHDIVPEYPETAVREAITNAICHRSYTDVGTIQVRIHDDRLEVWNPGTLPDDLPLKALYGPHASHPRNPLLAGALFRTRLIEQWGTGTLRIIEACRPFGIAVEFETAQGFFIVRLNRPVSGVQSRQESRIEPGAQSGVHSGVQLGAQSPMAVEVLKVLLSGEIGKKDIALALGKPGRTRYLNELMKRLLNDGLVEYTIPGKPTSRLQRYRLTARGRRILNREN